MPQGADQDIHLFQKKKLLFLLCHFLQPMVGWEGYQNPAKKKGNMGIYTIPTYGKACVERYLAMVFITYFRILFCIVSNGLGLQYQPCSLYSLAITAEEWSCTFLWSKPIGADCISDSLYRVPSVTINCVLKATLYKLWYYFINYDATI